MASSLKVVPQPVRRQVEDGLRAAIISGRFLPGDHMPDKLLCETFGTSRSVVREAVRLLEAEGLVVVHPNRGPFVALLSEQEVSDIYEVRGALEALAGEGFATRATDAERAALKSIFKELRGMSSNTDRDALLDVKRRFYEVLTAGSKNELVSKMLERTLVRVAQLRGMSLSSENRLPNTISEIGKIMAAIDKKDAAAAGAACRAHVAAAGAVAMDLLRERDSAPDRTRQGRKADAGG